MRYDAKRYYAFLGVAPASSDETIRAAYRRRAKELHPDAETGNASDFIRLKKVYDVLSDPAKRAQYDRASRPRERRMPTMAFAPDIPRPHRFRLGGMSLARFAAAFVFMAGLSLAAIEVILTQADVPLTSLVDWQSWFTPKPLTTLVKRDDPRLAEPASARQGETVAEYEDRVRREERTRGDGGSGLGSSPDVPPGRGTSP